MNKQLLLEKYAKLAVKIGLNVQKDQMVMINSSIDCAEFTRAVVKAAYEVDASYVMVEWSDGFITKTFYEYASEEQLKDLGLIVYICISRDVAWERIIANGIPGYLQGEADPRAVFDELSEVRENFYEKNADVIVPLEDTDLEVNLAVLEEKLSGYLSECC